MPVRSSWSRRCAVTLLSVAALLPIASAHPAAAGAPPVRIGLCQRSAYITVDVRALAAHLSRGDRFARGPADCEGRVRRYVTATMKVGQTVAESDSYAFNLDDDPRDVLDNALGHVFAGLSSLLGVDRTIAAAITSGQVVTLQAIRRGSWNLYPGVPHPHPVLTGGGAFSVDTTAPASSTLPASLTRRHLTAGPGTVPLRLALVPGQPPLTLDLVGARVRATCDAAGFGCTGGALGGGVPRSEVDGLVIPALATIMQATVAASCTIDTPDSCSPSARQLLDLFDANHDYVISADELRQNALIQAVLQPDVDLLDASGRPGHDGVKESLSLGVGFTTRYASFGIPRG